MYRGKYNGKKLKCCLWLIYCNTHHKLTTRYLVLTISELSNQITLQSRGATQLKILKKSIVGKANTKLLALQIHVSVEHIIPYQTHAFRGKMQVHFYQQDKINMTA